MEKIEYLYFLKGCNQLNIEAEEVVFANGLYNKNNNISSTMMYIGDSEEDLDYRISKYGYDSVFIIKIPKMIFNPDLKFNKTKDVPLPIWKRVDGKYYLSNELIYGVKNKIDDEIIYNENYREIHNPLGLVFDEFQERYFSDINSETWIKFSKYRKMYDYKFLVNFDIDKKIWDYQLLQYGQRFDTNKSIY